MKIRTCNVLASLIFLVAAVSEATHDLSGMVWPGLYRVTNIVGIFYVPFWLAAGIGILFHRRWGWLCGVLSAVLLLSHGVGINMGGSKEGVPYALAALILVPLMGYGKPWNSARPAQTPISIKYERKLKRAA